MSIVWTKKETSGALVVAQTTRPTADFIQPVCRANDDERLSRARCLKSCARLQASSTKPSRAIPVHRQRMSITYAARAAPRKTSIVFSVPATRSASSNAFCTAAGPPDPRAKHHLSHPVKGDKLYGGKRAGDLTPRQMLHAWETRLSPSAFRRRDEFRSPRSRDFAQGMRKIPSV